MGHWVLRYLANNCEKNGFIICSFNVYVRASTNIVAFGKLGLLALLNPSQATNNRHMRTVFSAQTHLNSLPLFFTKYSSAPSDIREKVEQHSTHYV